MAAKGKAPAKMATGSKVSASKGTKAEQRVTQALSNAKNKGVPISFAEASKKSTKVVDPNAFTPASPTKFKAKPV